MKETKIENCVLRVQEGSVVYVDDMETGQTILRVCQIPEKMIEKFIALRDDSFRNMLDIDLRKKIAIRD